MLATFHHFCYRLCQIVRNSRNHFVWLSGHGHGKIFVSTDQRQDLLFFPSCISSHSAQDSQHTQRASNTFPTDMTFKRRQFLIHIMTNQLLYWTRNQKMVVSSLDRLSSVFLAQPATKITYIGIKYRDHLNMNISINVINYHVQNVNIIAI